MNGVQSCRPVVLRSGGEQRRCGDRLAFAIASGEGSSDPLASEPRVARNASVDMTGLLSRRDQQITVCLVVRGADGTAGIGGSIDGESC